MFNLTLSSIFFFQVNFLLDINYSTLILKYKTQIISNYYFEIIALLPIPK